MKTHTVLKKTAAALLLLQAAHAWAGDPKISVGSLYDYLPGNTSSITKPIRNSGDETGFLRIEIKRIAFDAQGKAQETRQADDGTLQNRLIVSPNRLIVPPQGARSTRILYVGKRDREQYFRVRYLPVEPTRKAGFDVSPDIERKFAAVRSPLATTDHVFTPDTSGGSGVQPAHLLFETQSGVTQQLQRGHHYNGCVTVVFDSDVNP
ncbi:hypothetical protein WJ60_06420 [Burkholderia ubonensis]|uniref:hypothetical protein n=1 Tax=Burkholderia ubonensis TaxID=101571 RepID=UPI0007597383|nr:hypothetical protein [Burkholderia ubonensis]KVM73940.1 hypothetical protein WJ60_06420 [Burkholderia ubonensis]